MIKSIELPSSAFERCVLPAVYGEVAIMERFTGQRGMCQLLDYGLVQEAYWIVMKRYRCSLTEWRQRQPPLEALVPAAAATGTQAEAQAAGEQLSSQPSSSQPERRWQPAVALYLGVLTQVVQSLQLLAAENIVHFDLKGSNVLVDPLPGVSDTELWGPKGSEPPFTAVLADFGEAREYRSRDEAFTARNRGTEVYKSPEMLLMNCADVRASGTAAAAPAMPWLKGECGGQAGGWDLASESRIGSAVVLRCHLRGSWHYHGEGCRLRYGTCCVCKRIVAETHSALQNHAVLAS